MAIKTTIIDMQIGDKIICNYSSTLSNTFGTFTNLGTANSSLIPTTSSSTPNGSFYFIHSGVDTKGRIKLIADRNIQTSISWDTLNSVGAINEIQDPKTFISVDGNGTNGLNYDSSKVADSQNTCVFNNELYCTWEENNGVYQIRVKKYDGTSWTFIDGNGTNGLNYDITCNGRYPNLCMYNNNLYCTWSETNGTYNQIRVKKYDGTTWIFVDGNGTNGLNYSINTTACNSNLCVYNNELYCTWYESLKIRVKKYDGTTWTFIDGNGINYNTSKNAQYPTLCVYNNELYCSWNEYNGTIYNIRVKKYDGTTWIFIDGNLTNGINYNINQNAYNPNLCVYNNELYCSWHEYNGTTYQVRVKKYDGNTLNFIDGNGANGINYNISKDATYPTLCVFNNNLYCSWSESNQIKIKKYDGINWGIDQNFIDNINYLNNKIATRPNLCIYNNELYNSWCESNGSNQIRIKKLNYMFGDPNKTYMNSYLKLLTGGISSTDTDNEWDQIIVNSTLNNTITAGDNNVWNWSGVYSWTSDVISSTNTNRIIRGNTTASTSIGTSASTAVSTVTGYRPVLLIKVLASPAIFSGNLLSNSIHNENVILTGSITDNNDPTQKVQYKILLNDLQIYPTLGYTDFANSPVPINYSISNNLLTGTQDKITIITNNESNKGKIYDFYATLYNNAPTGILTLSDITTHNTNINLTGNLTDIDLDQISYRILINGIETLSFSDFIEDPYIDYIIQANDLNIGNNTITVEYKDNYKNSLMGTWNDSITVINNTPIINVQYINGSLIGTVTDSDSDETQYQILINGIQKYPDSDFTTLDSICNINYQIDRNDILLNQNNIITIKAKDNFNGEISREITFIGDYIGLMFMDENMKFYTTDIGKLLQYLDFGTITLGQITKPVKILIQNKFGFCIKDINLTVYNTLPNINIELCKENNPFIANDNLILENTYNPNDIDYFYIRLNTIESNSPINNGTFNIFAKATPLI